MGPERGSGKSELGSPAILDWLRPLEQVGVAKRTGSKYVGGKAASLGRLVRAGFAVPRGWVIPSRHFARVVEESLPRGHNLAALIKLADTRAGIERAARARDRFLAQPLPEGLSTSIRALFEAEREDAPWGFAARSSATCEDTESTSLAGLATSALGLLTPEAIEDGVKRVWASAFSPSALLYLGRQGIKSYEMAVVLQLMVRTEAAGVMFTAPPPGLEGELFGEDERLINATLGLGAPVVEGAGVFDVLRLSKGGAVVARGVADKRKALVVGARGVEIQDVPEASARAPAIGAVATAELASLADRLEATLGEPLDVEFAIEIGSRKVWVLQARPLTSGGFPEGGDVDTVWSRTNLGEALPGAATPLTWSIARAFAEKGFREAFEALGCHVQKDAVLVGNVQGRFYLNLSTFLRIAAQVPGLSPRALLGASGGVPAAIVKRLEVDVAEVSKRGFLARLPLHGPREIARKLRLEREVAVFEQEAERSRRVLLDLDLSLLPDDALSTTLKSAARLLDRTGTLMLACASTSLAAHLALCRLLSSA